MNDLLILANLLDGPKHGYALKKQVGLISGQGEMHNNLVYPLLRRFVESGWVSRHETSGQRGQTREVYALTAKGKGELLRRLETFTEKEAVSQNEFFLRAGLFMVLEKAARERILGERDRWLAAREEKLAKLRGAIDVGQWGGEVVRFLREQTRAERRWISRLRRKVSAGQSVSSVSRVGRRR
jgi:DNA-binding PadR family transcriptional regulator